MIKVMKIINFISDMRNLYKSQQQKFMIPDSRNRSKKFTIPINIKKIKIISNYDCEIKRHRRSGLKLAMRHVFKNWRSESALRHRNTIWIWRALLPHFISRRDDTTPLHHCSCDWISETCFTATMGTFMSAPQLSVEVFPHRTIDVMVEQLRWKDRGHLRFERGGRRRRDTGRKNKPGASLKGRRKKRKTKRKKTNKY